MVTHVSPVAVQRGTTAEVTVACRTSSLAGAYKVLFDGTGVDGRGRAAARREPKADPKSPVPVLTALKLKVTVAADAPVGVREFRIATRHGISSLGQLVVVDAPVVLEKPGINTPEKAQTGAGAVRGLRADRGGRERRLLHVSARRPGRCFTFEVFCARMQDKIHDLQKHADPLIAVYDADGKELAASDDGFFADPVLTFTVPKDGEYRVAVRDAKYDGDPRWVYALTITDTPLRLAGLPARREPRADRQGGAGRVGAARQRLDVVAHRAQRHRGSIPLPSSSASPRRTRSRSSSPPLPLVAEVEPNDTPQAGDAHHVAVRHQRPHRARSATSTTSSSRPRRARRSASKSSPGDSAPRCGASSTRSST